ncbi:MAG: hypothetical protein Tsb0020_39250 [Haliangiales bacterium]
MRQLRQHLDLAQKALHKVLSAQREHLDRHRLIGAEIAATVDLTHPPYSGEQLDNIAPRDNLSRLHRPIMRD